MMHEHLSRHPAQIINQLVFTSTSHTPAYHMSLASSMFPLSCFGLFTFVLFLRTSSTGMRRLQRHFGQLFRALHVQLLSIPPGTLPSCIAGQPQRQPHPTSRYRSQDFMSPGCAKAPMCSRLLRLVHSHVQMAMSSSWTLVFTVDYPFSTTVEEGLHQTPV